MKLTCLTSFLRYLLVPIYDKIFRSEGDGSEDAFTLYSLADEFLEAAIVLQNTPPVRVDYSLVAYYLLGHAAELMLKAFLYTHNRKLPDIVNLGHDLKRLIKDSKRMGLSDAIPLAQVRQLAKMYKNKEFEYRKNMRRTLPSLDLLTDEVQALQKAVFTTLCPYG